MVTPPRERISILTALLLVAASLATARTLLAGAAALTMIRRDLPFAEALPMVEQDDLVVGLAQLLGLAVALGIGVAIVHGGDARYRDALDVKPVRPIVVLLALCAGLAVHLPIREAVNLLLEVAPSLEPDERVSRALHQAVRIQSLRDALVVPLASIAIPAVFEELLFRGLLQPALARRYGPLAGLILASVLFGASHLAPLPILYATLMGALLGYVRDRAGSVMPCIAMHGAFNALPILLDPSLVRVRGFNTVGADVAHIPLGVVVGAAVVAAGALTVMGLVTRDAPPG